MFALGPRSLAKRTSISRLGKLGDNGAHGDELQELPFPVYLQPRRPLLVRLPPSRPDVPQRDRLLLSILPRRAPQIPDGSSKSARLRRVQNDRSLSVFNGRAKVSPSVHNLSRVGNSLSLYTPVIN
jgi:hypothetical protein